MYNHKVIEKKWQEYWEKNNTFKTDTWDFSKPKYYALDMFPYPSGVGLHAGHPEGYTATDIVSRMKKMQGYNVLHPMGFDSFGLPAEQFAVDTGNHPAIFTNQNIQTFTAQLKMLGFSFDWDRAFSTTDPEYFKWTQWIFKRLYEDGYAKMVDMPVNWCEELGTVLANDEVIDGKSERGGYPVVRKNMKHGKELTLLEKKYKLSYDKLDIKKVARIVSLTNAFIISTVVAIVCLLQRVISNTWLWMFSVIGVGFILLIPMILLFYSLIGKHLRKKQEG